MVKQTCPYCGSQNIAEYLYGYPDLDDDELEKQIENKEVILGGCIITDDNPSFHCNDCGMDFS